MARRRRGLGHSSSVHKAASQVSLRQVERSLSMASRALTTGKCGAAFGFMMGAASSFADAVTHHTSGGGSVSDLGTRLNNEYHDVRETFVKSCIVKSGAGMGRARRRRR